ncbi:Glycosyltransferase Family 41 protein [Tuber magnatum]|uniref:protein O-GlcNAc transferase n=1 Tax=Tuber magnatum TaxID=42249 RepID=A0A317SRV2_9PEZI|nr:Glycosyltransferase Family 41 protein [Tuber magnatum]
MLPSPAFHRHQSDQTGARAAAAPTLISKLLHPSNPNTLGPHHFQHQHHHQPILQHPNISQEGLPARPMYRAQLFSAAMPAPSQHTYQENLLRRKTPSGTLPAAYDAAPMEWSIRPNKHILLPTPQSNSPQARSDPQLTRHLSWDNNASVGVRPWDGGGELRSADVAVGGGNIAPTVWVTQPSSQTPLDDNIDPYVRQFLLQQNQMVPPISDNIYMGGRPCGFQPFYNPITAPTAPCEDLNDLMGCGNYNPVPRDSNWYGHYGAWGNGNTAPTQLPQTPIYYVNSVYTPSPHQMNGAPLWTSQQLPAIDSVSVSTFPPHITSPYPLNPPSVNTPEVQLQLLQLDGPGSSLAHHDTTNPQFRDKVLAWAHGVYVDLLAALQAQQRQLEGNSQEANRSRTQLKVGLFPRPPLQPQVNNWRSDNACAPHPFPFLFAASDNPSEHNTHDIWSGGEQSYEKKQPMDCYSAGSLHRASSGIGNNAPNILNITSLGGFGNVINQRPSSATASAVAALDMLNELCASSNWAWLDGMLLGGCLAYGLGDLTRAIDWYSKILEVDRGHVEALSNLAATLLSLNRREEAEQYWLRAVKKRPSYFEAVEHLVGLLCGEHRGKEAVNIINFVESKLRRPSRLSGRNPSLGSSGSSDESSSTSLSASPELKFDYDTEESHAKFPSAKSVVYHGSNEFLIPSSDNGRMLALIHAKGNMLYTLGDNAGAAKAFEDAVLLGADMQRGGIKGLINKILAVLRPAVDGVCVSGQLSTAKPGPVLLTPEKAVLTTRFVFPPTGELPGLRDIPSAAAKRAAISTASNSLLSLAKIFQDGMSSGHGAGAGGPRSAADVKDILALYYLSLSLHPSPSTANNVGILLASVQQVSAFTAAPTPAVIPRPPGVGQGSGINLALQYYYYGLSLDSRHAHLYTNLGSLLKDINQLNAAIKMYEQAVACDPTFDIALANLANAVKDQGRIGDAIGYYRRAVNASPEFAEAVCGLANALNSVCDWKGRGGIKPLSEYSRPTVPSSLSTPSAPTVLPFHTFTCPLSAKQVRMISQRNGLRISCSTLRAPWFPPYVFPPPAPPAPYLRIGYVSSDFNNHPLAHLMQSVFGLHDPARAKAYCYATTASDNSEHRKQIERESPVFHDAHSWGPDRLVRQIVNDGIHILINLNGFTRGARNEIFAARPAPIQMSFMGFAGTLGAEWCDYLYADSTAIPVETLRPWRRNVDLEDEGHEDITNDNGEWVYSENIIFAKYSFFCCDHRQSAPDSKSRQLTWAEEQTRRWAKRKEIFPQLKPDNVILGNFNQLYKIEPTTFRTWLRILSRVPKAILWLLRFPDLGESNLKALAVAWAGEEVSSRIIFTDVAPKLQHISRAQVCDIFLDTPECNAHTTAADVLWSGTPLLTFPRHQHKMCSRIAASILRAAVPQTPEGKAIANSLIVGSEEEYEDRAVTLVSNLVYDNDEGRGIGELGAMRQVLFEHRWKSVLFDTKRWVRDLEDAYHEAWRRWVSDEGGDIYLEEVQKMKR